MLKKIVWLTGLLCLVGAVGGRFEAGQAGMPVNVGSSKDKPAQAQPKKPVDYAPDELLVKFKGVKGLPAKTLGKAQQTEISRRVAALPEAAQAALKEIQGEVIKIYGQIGVFRVRIPKGTDLMQALDKLHRSGTVIYAEPNYRRQVLLMPNDPDFGNLWGLHNIGQSGGTPDADIDAPEGWDIRTDASTTVAVVIDTGVDYNHQDLAPNMWTNPGEIPGNNIDDDGNGYIDDVHGINAITGTGDPMDDHSHGTHCAGTIGGRGNNSLGVTGVAWTTRIMALKFLDASGSGYTSDAVECILYAIQMKQPGDRMVLSNSWGGGGYSQSLYDAIAAARDHNILFIAAAGNDSQNTDTSPHYPSSYDLDNIIAVGSSTRYEAVSWFSNYGVATVDLFAPGSSIYSTLPGNSYGSMSGTSMACPHVSGVAAVLWAYYPAYNWQRIKGLILNGAEDGIGSPYNSVCVTQGRLNLRQSLEAGLADDPAVFSVSPSTGGSGTTVQIRGVNFGATPGTVSFQGYVFPAASIVAWADETITVVIPAGCPSGPGRLQVTTGAGTSRGAYFNCFQTVPLGEALDNQTLTYTSGGDAVWYGQATTYYYGGSAAQSGDIGDNQSSFFQTTINGPTTVKFWWKVSSELGWDYLQVFVDEILIEQISGEVNWQEKVLTLGSGSHVVKWVYYKDSSISSGSDCGWVDYLQVKAPLPQPSLNEALDNSELSFATGGNAQWFGQSGVWYFGGSAAQSGSIADSQETRLQTAVTGPGVFSFYWKASSEAGYDTLSFSVNGAEKASISGWTAWQSYSFFLDPGVNLVAWTYRKDGSVSRGFDCGWVDKVSISTISLGAALDNTTLNFSTSGAAPWFGTNTSYYYDGDSAQSGPIDHNQSSVLETNLVGPGYLRFYWRVSSEPGYDFLSLAIDGVEQPGAISGTVDWQAKEYFIPGGSHTVRWIYRKDGSESQGRDCGWLDKVSFIQSNPAPAINSLLLDR